MLGLVFVTLYPFVYMINVSLSSEYYVLRQEVSFYPKGFTLQYYESVLKDPRILTGYKNTLLYASVGTFIALVLTSMGAYALSKRYLIFRRQIMLAIVFTMLFSGGMIPTYLVIKSLGFLNTMWAIVIPGAISTMHLIVMRTFFEGIPDELEEAGKIDGLTDIGVFIRIIIPLSKAVYAAIGLFVAVGIWNNFYGPLLYLQDQSKHPLQLVLRNLIIENQIGDEAAAEMAPGMAVQIDSLKFATIMVATIPIIMLYPFLQKYFVKGVMIGSVKG